MTGTDAGSEVSVTLRLPPSAAHVRTARLIAAAMARRSGVGDAALDEVRLAVGEACARAVRVQERQGVGTPVTVEFVETGRFRVSVIDGAKVGSGEEPSAAPTPAGAPWVDPSGDALGFALLGAVVQDLVVDPDAAGGTRVTMSWPLG